MKAKKIEKKLVLNKATIVNLDKKELNDVKGGSVFLCTRAFDCESLPVRQCN